MTLTRLGKAGMGEAVTEIQYSVTGSRQLGSIPSHSHRSRKQLQGLEKISKMRNEKDASKERKRITV